ncbi:MAG: hypothetical protein OWS74_00005 [Firmicutes bacterium]|nr:hypothetical protein [Bacillota bacterium]
MAFQETDQAVNATATEKEAMRKHLVWDLAKIIGSLFTMVMLFGFLITKQLGFLYFSVVPPVVMAFPQGEDGRKPLVTMVLLGFAMVFSFPSTAGDLFPGYDFLSRENFFILLSMTPQTVYISTNWKKVVLTNRTLYQKLK